MERWWRISGPRWTFSIATKNGIVTKGPDIAWWTLGKPVEIALSWYEKHGADDVKCLDAERGALSA